MPIYAHLAFLLLLLSAPAFAAPELPVVKHLGVTFGRWDPRTGKAGDFVFSAKYNYDTTQKALIPFGETIVNDLTGTKGKVNNSLMYYLPAGVPVKSMIDGVVLRIEQNSGATSDLELHISPNDSYGPWLLIIDHVANVSVKVGQRVAAGDGVAETSGKQLEFTINRQFIPLRAGAPTGDFCPLEFLDAQAKDSLLQILRDFQTDWVSYKANPALYDTANMAYPGCVSRNLLTDNGNAERLFEWAEAAYPQLLSPAGSASLSAAGYYYRYYPTSNAYLGMKDGHMWWLDPKSNSAAADLGALTNFLPQAFAAGY